MMSPVGTDLARRVEGMAAEIRGMSPPVAIAEAGKALALAAEVNTDPGVRGYALAFAAGVTATWRGEDPAVAITDVYATIIAARQ